jgi:plasmid stability protein
MATKKAQEKPERKMLTLRMPVELHRQLKAEAARRGESMEAIAEQALRAFLPIEVMVRLSEVPRQSKKATVQVVQSKRD